jgi:dihydroorotase
MFDLIIRGGLVVSAEGIDRVNLAVSGGTVAAVCAPDEDVAGAKEIDAAGKFIIPGLVDAHAHIPGYLLSTRLDDFGTATSAAAVGGVTTVMLMPTDDPRTATPGYFERKRRLGEERSHVDFAIQALIGPKTGRAEIEEMAALGAISFELFLAYGGNPSFIIGHDDYELHRLMQLVRDVDGIAGMTPHSASLIAKLTELQKKREAARQPPDPLNRKPVSTRVQDFALTRPTLSEGLGIVRACTVAAETGTRIHIRSLSSKSSVGLVERFRDAVRLSSEVMSHHLLFRDDDSDRLGPYGIIVPPIRTLGERDNLREALRTARIEMVVSDHSPVLRDAKELGWADIWKTPPGMPGLQTLCASMMVLVDDGVFSLQDVVRSCARAPAAAFGLYPRKGALQVGSDADMIIVDPTRPTLIEDQQQRSKARYTTLKGRVVNSRVDSVFLRGKLIAQDGDIVSGPTGRFQRA